MSWIYVEPDEDIDRAVMAAALERIATSGEAAGRALLVMATEMDHLTAVQTELMNKLGLSWNGQKFVRAWARMDDSSA